MPSAKESIDQVESLPVEERALVVDSLLQTLNRPDPEIDRKGAEVARRRLADFRAGRVRPVPGDEVFERARKRSRGGQAPARTA
jgi:putative addiction module component (TIGR02574 family)